MKIISLLIFFSVTISFVSGQTDAHMQDSIKNYLVSHRDSLNPIEGLWEVITTQEYYHFDTLYDVVKFPETSLVALLKKEDRFRSTIISGEPYDVEFNQTDVRGVYLYRNYYSQLSQFSKPQAVISKAGEMEFTYDLPDDYARMKLGNIYKNGTRVVNILKWKKRLPLQ